MLLEKKNSDTYPFSDTNSKETSALQIVYKRDTFHANVSPGHDAKIVKLVAWLHKLCSINRNKMKD